MYSVWTKKAKTDEEKQEIQKTLRGASYSFGMLSEVLKDLEKELDRAEVNPKTYDIPGWDYRQAHNNGYRQCLSIIQKLITLDPKETDDPKLTNR